MLGAPVAPSLPWSSPRSPSISCCKGTGPTPLQSPGCLWSLVPSLGSCPSGLRRCLHHDQGGLKPGCACPERHCIVLSFPIARLDEVPSRLAVDQGKMTFHVPFLSSTGEVFVVCPKEQLQPGVGRATQEMPCPFGRLMGPEAACGGCISVQSHLWPVRTLLHHIHSV